METGALSQLIYILEPILPAWIAGFVATLALNTYRALSPRFFFTHLFIHGVLAVLITWALIWLAALTIGPMGQMLFPEVESGILFGAVLIQLVVTAWMESRSRRETEQPPHVPPSAEQPV